jgi:DNA repair exonuclease SbcCD ATPase subunit
MVLRFNKVKFSNILSFGAAETEFLFTKGFHLIVGINGSGKSALLDAISFCLFGQPYRKIKIKELINRKNRKGLTVTCEFTIDNQIEYSITRQLKPDKITIIKNGEELDLLSSKKLNQDEIDKITGINYQMFKQIISLAVNYNRPFLALPAMEKRDIVEQIFNIKIFGQMLKIHKINNTDLKFKSELNDRSISIYEENIKSMRKRLKESKEASDNFQKNKENDLKNLQIRIDSKLKDKNDLNNKIFLNNEMIKSFETYEDLDELKEQRDNLTNKINEKEYNIKTYNKNISLLSKSTGACPLCNTAMTDDLKEKEILRLKSIILKIENTLETLIINKDELENKIHIKEQSKTKKEQIDNDNKKFQDQINMIDDDLIHFQISKNEIEERILNLNIEAISAEFDMKVNEYRNVWKENQNIKIKLKNNDIVTDILSENGIKSFLFKKLTPILNAKVNKYIQLFDLSVRIEFDEFMNERISNIENLKKEVSYYSYSEGEKKRIDTAILLAFIDITKAICNWQSNVIIFDELLDSAVDSNGLEKMIDCLKQIAQVDSLCAYVISHRLQDANGFSSRYEIIKDSYGFSKIAKI